jgi:hypothetical protein
MKVNKSIGLLCVLILAMSVVHSASAALPYSTYGFENRWSGYKDYTQDNFDIRVSFNVYDNDLYPNQFDWDWLGDPMPEEYQYIYAYEIFNMGDESNNEIAAFTLLYADGSAIPQHLMHLTHSQDNGGIAPDPDGTPNQGEWVWTGTYGYIETGQHSWLLVFCSDHAPVKGSFEVQAGGEMGVPEPATIVFFGSAAGWILTRRNNKRR